MERLFSYSPIDVVVLARIRSIGTIVLLNKLMKIDWLKISKLERPAAIGFGSVA